MVESLSEFPLRKLRFDPYLILEVILLVDYEQVEIFMFSLNKQTRSFLKDNFIIIRNGFVNEGLVTYDLVNLDFNGFYYFENLYN